MIFYVKRWFARLFMLALLGTQALYAAEPSSDGARIVKHAILATMSVKEYAAEVESTTLSENLHPAPGEDGKPRLRRDTATLMFRAPGYSWKSMSFGDSRWIELSDGKTNYQFIGLQPDKIRSEDLQGNSGVALKSMADVTLNPASPLNDQIFTLDGLMAGQNTSALYRGQEMFDGVACDVVEFAMPIDNDTWDSARKARPELPEKPGTVRQLYYFGADDGLVHRSARSMLIPGVSRQLQETRYRFGTPDPAQSFVFERLAAAVKPLLGNKPFPEVQTVLNPTGQPLPEVGGLRADGKKLRWTDFRGQVLVVETWATWCHFCKEAMPYYETMRKRLAGQNVAFVALNFEEKAAEYGKWVKANRDKYGFIFARADMTPQNWEQQLDRFKGALPAFYVVGRDGNVISGYIGYGYGAGEEDPRLLAALNKAGVKLP